MSNFVNMDIFSNYQKYIDNEHELREVCETANPWKTLSIVYFQNIRIVVREIEHLAKEALIKLQVIHSDLSQSKWLFLKISLFGPY